MRRDWRTYRTGDARGTCRNCGAGNAKHNPLASYRELERRAHAIVYARNVYASPIRCLARGDAYECAAVGGSRFRPLPPPPITSKSPRSYSTRCPFYTSPITLPFTCGHPKTTQFASARPTLSYFGRTQKTYTGGIYFKLLIERFEQLSVVK